MSTIQFYYFAVLASMRFPMGEDVPVFLRELQSSFKSVSISAAVKHSNILVYSGKQYIYYYSGAHTLIAYSILLKTKRYSGSL